MDGISSYMAASLQSLQSAIAMSTLGKAMNKDAATMGAMLTDFQSANPPAPPVPGVGQHINISA